MHFANAKKATKQVNNSNVKTHTKHACKGPQNAIAQKICGTDAIL